MTIANKLDKLIKTKQDIKTAIESKGIEVGDAQFAEYAQQIEKIESGGSGKLEGRGIVFDEIISDRVHSIKMYDNNPKSGYFFSNDGFIFRSFWSDSSGMLGWLRKIEILHGDTPVFLPNDFAYNSPSEIAELILPTPNNITEYYNDSLRFERLSESAPSFNERTLGAPGFPVTHISLSAFPRRLCNILNIYVSDPSNPNLPNSPWGLQGIREINYLQA